MAGKTKKAAAKVEAPVADATPEQDNPETPYHDARSNNGKFQRSGVSPHQEIVTDNAVANKQVEDAVVKAQWALVEREGLAYTEGFEHPGINPEKPTFDQES